MKNDQKKFQTPCQSSLRLRFIGQGLGPEKSSTVGDLIIESLESKEYISFKTFIAFVSTGGLRNTIDQIIAFRDKGGDIRLYLGVDLNATSKEALEQLLAYKIESYVVYSPNNIIYHPKVYTFEGKKVTRVIIGSSNFTESGLFQSIEASVCVDFSNEDENGINFLTDVYDYYNQVINLKHPSCQKLTPSILRLLVENKIVLPEKIIRAKNNKVNQEYGRRDATKHNKLLEVFAKIRPKRPPKGFKKIVRKEELIVRIDEKVEVVCEDAQLTSGSMWIETGKMTGGSRNILDLSKSGKHEGEVKFGSVSFFGINPDKTDTTKSINIQHGGNVYKDNPIFFAEDNSNWRIQLKGETDDGKKLTTISKPHLGQDGGFVDKVLLFTRIDKTNFILEILDIDNIEKLVENSSTWARGGKGGTGRAYGII